MSWCVRGRARIRVARDAKEAVEFSFLCSRRTSMLSVDIRFLDFSEGRRESSRGSRREESSRGVDECVSADELFTGKRKLSMSEKVVCTNF